MRLAFDAKRALNNSTGLGNHARILLNALLRDFPGNAYLLFTPKLQAQFLDALQGDFSLHLPETKFQQSFRSLWRSFHCKQQLLRERVDIYHGLSNELPFGIHSTGIATVVTIHDLIFLKHKEQYPYIDRKIYEAKTRYAAKHADKVIAVSQQTKEELIELYKTPASKIEVINPSVEPVFYTECSIAEKEAVITKYQLPNNYLLCVGSFFPRKNHKTILEAFALIAKQTEYHLVLAGGSGNQKQEIEQQIHCLNLSNRVHIRSSITNADMPAVYQQSKALITASFFEGFGAPVLEGLFSRIPVIASNIPSHREAGGNGALYFNPNSAEELAHQLTQVLNNIPLRTQLERDGYAHALQHTDTIWAQQTMQLYNKL